MNNPRNPSQTLPSGWIEIGKIVSAQGMKGEVRVYPDSDFPERFETPGQRWLLKLGQEHPEAVELTQGRYLGGKGLYVMQFAEVTTRTAAEALQGCRLVVPESDRPPLAEGEFHILDLVGLPVFDQTTQAHLGTVISVVPAGNDLLEVQPPTPQAKPFLIPFVEAIVPVVDLEAKRIEVTPPRGLIEF